MRDLFFRGLNCDSGQPNVRATTDNLRRDQPGEMLQIEGCDSLVNLQRSRMRELFFSGRIHIDVITEGLRVNGPLQGIIDN